MAPNDDVELELDTADKYNLLDALDHSRGFIAVAGLDDEAERVDRLRERVDAANDPDDPEDTIEIQEGTAVRGLASLTAYREQLLEEDEVGAAAEVEETIRALADQHEVLARLTENRTEIGGGAVHHTSREDPDRRDIIEDIRDILDRLDSDDGRQGL